MINCNLQKNFKKNVCKKAVGEAHFTMIVPKGDNSGNKIKPSLYNKYIDRVNKRFGGTTTKPITLGCWVDEKRGKLQCEPGFAIETFRDFDLNPDMKKKNMNERKKQLNNDFRFMKMVSKDIAKETGQDSIPVIFDNISDVSLVKGKWKKKIAKSKLTGKKIKGNLWKKHI